MFLAPRTALQPLLRRLAVQRFRNLPDVSWEIGPGSQLILGRNGAGKTSLLEAVYLTATARSFRTAQLEDCVRREAEAPDAAGTEVQGFVARAEVTGPPLADLAVSWTDAGLVRTLDDKAVPLAAWLEVLPVVIWTSREDEILAGVPERRRRMIDAGLVAERPERVGLLARHRRILTQKRELLRRRQPGLEAWNRLLAEAGSALQRARAEWVGALAARLEGVLAASSRGLPPIELEYEPSPRSGPHSAEALFDSLMEVADDELRSGRPCIGPHLDRLSIGWGAGAEGASGGAAAVDVSRVASAGERKALGLFLVAAQAELLEAAGRAPTILVDDVDAELDLEALLAVWRVLAEGRQVLATSSRDEVRERLPEAAVWRLEGGSSGRGPVRNEV
jgi:DNA replication and repair protein RecF